ncbi:hypothetical protein JCM10213v2_008855 [Rhodosporidiobolus nylandii]
MSGLPRSESPLQLSSGGDPDAQRGRRESSHSSNATSVAPTPRSSTYSDLPSPPVDLARLKGSIGPSYDPRFPFPVPDLPPSRNSSFENLRDRSPSPSNSPLTTSPVWPHPDAFTFAPTSRAAAMRPVQQTRTHHARTHHPSLSASLTHALKPRSLLSSKLTRFEVALVDRLAEFLERDGTVESIREASGVISADLSGERGRRRLSQTPIRIRLSVRLPSSSPFILSFVPAPSFARLDGVSTTLPTHRLVTLPASPALQAPIPKRPPLAPRTDSSSRSRPPSFHRLFTQSPINPFRTLSDTDAIGTPSSERSGDSFFTAFSSPPAGSPLPSPSSAASTSAPSLLRLGLNDSQSLLPQIGSFAPHRQEYVDGLVDELEACVSRRSLVKLKVVVGQQAWKLDAEETVGSSTGEGPKEWKKEEIEGWAIDSSRSLGTPHFDWGMSRSTILSLVDRLQLQGFSKKRTTSQVHILHLDRHRAVYAVATAALRGHDLSNLPPGQCANGTLSLVKCSTLPSKPFSLSISTPGTVDEDGEIRLREGSDLRVKVLADKAATSPSNELSRSFQQATWDVDDEGIFHVNVQLDPGRFSASQTSSRWTAKERWENDTFRAVVSENRHHGSSTITWELELTSRQLNNELAECSLNQLRRKFDRELVTRLVDELLVFCDELVAEEGKRSGAKSPRSPLSPTEKSAAAVQLETEDAAMVATAGVSPLDEP